MRPAPLAALASRIGLVRRLLDERRRQVQVERGANANCRLHADGAAVLLHDGMGRGQSETMAFAFGGEIRVKNMSQLLGGNAAALVLNGDVNISPWTEPLQARGPSGVQAAIIGANANHAAIGPWRARH